ncbi:hypothetical protein RchiOBHm_Chr5g0034711 [Rosa chinensis]|uniref:Uncharacterized protein n=1 Tax=Rosa chinensis TaxID=74649 RepID=A0A2P6QB08_ROSCH|nr:probable cyclic nucleotide-gated ion channel 20, chloroplastic isoform X2 [Rosa chinensis]PRQ31368.1 hypothetical protein RchiOBHm_Chr5g0034711 [Rosa chinensis]
MYGDAKGWFKRTCSFLYPYVLGVVNPDAKAVRGWNKFFVISVIEIVDQPYKIALNYLHGNFLVDIIIVLPLPQRVNQCLRDACHNSYLQSCGSLIDCCNAQSIPESTKWRENEEAAGCFNQEGDFSYGVYTLVVNLTTRDSMTKYLYSLFWGFQGLLPWILSSHDSQPCIQWHFCVYGNEVC